MTIEPHNIALFCTVTLLAITAYFLLGSVPLLVLKHDDPVDARFIRSFYITYFKFASIAATATAVSYAAAARPLFAAIATAVVILTLVLRAKLIPKMDQLDADIQANNASAIPAFRKIHKSAILLNTCQLAALLGSLVAL